MSKKSIRPGRITQAIIGDNSGISANSEAVLRPVIQLPVTQGLNPGVVADVSIIEFDEYTAADKQYLRLKTRLKSLDTKQLQHGDLETLIKEDGFEVLRLLLQEHLDERADEEPKLEQATGTDGIRRTHCRENCERSMETIFGEVSVRRKGYSARKQSSLYPLDGQLNLPAKTYSHGLMKLVAQEAARGSFDQAVITIDKTTGGHVPKRQAENISVEVSQYFDEFYAAGKGQGAEETDDLLVMSTDGKGIVMRTEALREVTAKAAAKEKHKVKTRLSKGEKPNRKRMAQVGTNYTITRNVRRAEEIMSGKKTDATRPRATNKRVLASVVKESGKVIAELFEESARRDPEHKRKCVMLIDGNAKQLSDIRSCMKRYKATGTTLILDFVHVLEYLWKAAFCFASDGSEEAEAWVKERATLILKGKCSSVAAGMRRSATMRGLKKDKRKAVDKCAVYLLKYKDLLQYDKYLAEGFPIATGVIEGACRHLVKDRMDITGARWGLDCAEAVLKLRSLNSSGDFDAYWKFYQARSLEGNHASRYKDIPWKRQAA